MIFPQPGGVTGLAVGEEPFIVPQGGIVLCGLFNQTVIPF
jgi:hypothetical protein